MQSTESEASEIPAMLDRLGVASPRARWAASNIYIGARSIRGESLRGLQAAAVYASCRLLGVPRTLREVGSACGVKAGEVARIYRKILLLETDLMVPVPDPASFVPDIAKRAMLGSDVEKRAIEILSAMKEAHVGEGRAPTVVAAAVLYQAYSESHPWNPSLRAEGQKSQKSIADAAGVTDVSVRIQLRWIRLLLDRGG
jgi:transcription initiation factor TFIIB